MTHPSLICPDCRQAETNPMWGCYSGSCAECQTRSLANGPLAYAATLGSAGSSRAVIQEIGRIWPDDQEHGRRRLRFWFDAIKAAQSDGEGMSL